MAWIQTLSAAGDDEQLAELMRANADPRSGKLDEILRIHSLHPRGFAAHVALYEAVMAGSATLRKVERELIAFVVSSINACHY